MTIITPPDIFPEAQAYLRVHGCEIVPQETYCEIRLPEGTTREEIVPRMPQGERFRLLLPDGTFLQQTYMRYVEQSMLFYPREEASSDAKTK